MTAVGVQAGRLAAGRPWPRPTIAVRVATTFAALFAVAGIGLLALNYALLQHSLQVSYVTSAVPSYPASLIISRDKAVISNPQASALDKAAAQGQLALAERHPHARLTGALLPEIGSQSAIQAAQARAFDDAFSQLIRQSALILAPLALLAVALGWLVARRMLRPVRRLTAAARELSVANLHQRLHLNGPRDELKELGDTFDQMLSRLETAFESQRRFVANASHELRTPLTIMRTELEVTLDKGQATPGQLRAMGEVVRAAVSRSERLVDGLLTLAESERGIERAELIDLSDLAGPALSLIGGDALSGGIRLTTNLAPAPVRGTRVLLERLVENLADNAVRHNQPGGWLTVTTARHGDIAELTIQNSGLQITQDQAATVFEPFRRLHADRVGSARGNGLGLSIVRAVARAHGGDATVTPITAGGLQVTVTLPVAPVAASPRG